MPDPRPGGRPPRSGLQIASIVTFAMVAAFFAWFGFALGQEMPNGPMPFYGMSAVSVLIAIASFFYRGGPVAEVVEVEPGAAAQDLSWLDQKKLEFANFDLSRLNAVGWILFLASMAVCLGAIFLTVRFLDTENPAQGGKDRGLLKILGVGCLLLAIGYFLGARSLLGYFGISIYREAKPAENATDDA
jgi:hypothetical protein